MPEEITIHQPNTAKEALALWDEGKTLRAFRVNSEGSSQEEIYAAAFDMIRDTNVAPSAAKLPDHKTLNKIEHESAHSIAFVAMRQGWSSMVQAHIHPNSPEITIRKPA
jgi:hypothetical protein